MNKLDMLIEFEKLTDELLAIDLSKDIHNVIDEIEVKLEKRDEMIIQIDSNTADDRFSEGDLLRILQKNNQLETMFTEIKLKIANSIGKVGDEKRLSSIKKKANRGYLNVGKQNNGYFIDKKK